jgi:probable F420-dependent oxidoreductase
MRFNLHLPYSLVGAWELWLRPGSLERIATDAQAAGFHSISISEHPIPTTEWLDSGGHHTLDPFVALSFLAAGSTSLRLLTNVLVLPYRSPVLTAKAIASLDVLSGGRVTVGTAVGYLEPEFAALGVGFHQRAAAFERAIEEMKMAWASDGQGGMTGYVMWPPPAQRPHPPLWVGGNSAAARRRAISLGDGWMPFAQSARMAAVTGTPAIATFEDLAAGVARLGVETRESNRETPLDVCFGVFGRSSLYREDASPQEVDNEVQTYAEIGVTWLTVQSRAASPDDMLQELDRWSPMLSG